MAALTWRNVDQLDSGAALQGIQQATALIGQAFSGADNSLKNYDDAKIEDTSNDFITNILTKYQGNPDQLNADLASGKLLEGIDPRRLNAEARQTIARRPEDLLRYEAGTIAKEQGAENLDFSKFSNTNTKEDRAASVAARPVAQMLIAAGSGPDSAQKREQIMQEYAGVVGNLSAEEQFALASNPVAFEQAVLGLTTTRNNQLAQGDERKESAARLVAAATANKAAVFNLERGRWEFDNQKVAAADQIAGATVGEYALSVSNNGASAVAALENNKNYQALTPGGKSVARGIVQAQFGDLYADPGPTGSVGSPDVAPAMNIDTGRGYTVKGFKDAQNRPVVFSEPAANAFAQMVKDSGGVVKGGDVNSTQRTASKNRKVKGVENSTHLEGKGNAVDMSGASGAWVRKNGAKYGWYPNDYKGTHGGHYEYRGGGGRAIGAAPGAALSTSASVRKSQNNTGTGQAVWEAGLGNGSSPLAVASAMRKSTFKGVSQDFLVRELNRLVKESRPNGKGEPTLNYVQAARIIEEAADPSRTNWDRVWNGGLNDTQLGNGTSYNRFKANSLVKEARQGEYERRAVSNKQIDYTVEQVAQAESNVNALRAQIDSVKRSGRPGVIAQQLPSLERSLAKAEKLLRAMGNDAGDTVRNDYEKPDDGKGLVDYLKNIFQ